MERDGRPAEFLAHKAKAVLADLTLNQHDCPGRTTACAMITTAASWPTFGSPDHTLVNAELVRQGLARVYFIVPNLRYQKVLLAAQQEAIEAQRGVGSSCSSRTNPSTWETTTACACTGPSAPWPPRWPRPTRCASRR